jgi:G8 domain
MRLPRWFWRQTPKLYAVLATLCLLAGPAPVRADALRTRPALVRSAQSGAWSDPATWEGNKVPAAGARLQVRAGHRVVYDVQSDKVFRSLHVAGTLTFAADKDTRLDVGLIKVQPGDDASEEGFACDAHGNNRKAADQPALEVGTPLRPIAAGHTARIRLVYIEGMDRESCPAIVSCSGQDVPEQTRYAFVSGKPDNKEADFPRPLDPIDDLPPATVVTHVGSLAVGKLVVRGTTADNGKVVKVLVNGQAARALTANFAEWEVVLDGVRPGAVKISAHAEDEAGNVEKRPHVLIASR